MDSRLQRWLTVVVWSLLCIYGVPTASAAADPSLTLQTSTAMAGGTAVVPIVFSTGTTDIIGFQIDLILPDTLSFTSVIEGPAATAAGKTAFGTLISPNVLRVVVVGFNFTPFSSGVAALVTLQVAGGTSPGSQFIGVANDLLSDPGASLVMSNAAGGIVTVLTGGAISLFGIGVTDVTTTGARVVWNTDVSGDSAVDYGLTSAYGQTATDGTSVTSHSLTIGGLSSPTVYHCRVRSNGISSGDFTFSTAGGAAPVISAAVGATLGESSATVTWNTDIPSDSQVTYGLTTAYGLASAADPTLGLSHSMNLVGLSSSTIYHFQVRSRNAAGLLSLSGDSTFMTASATVLTSSPVISGVTVSNLTAMSAKISWTTDQPSDSTVNYGSSGHFFLTSAVDTRMVTSHSVNISSLTPQFVYDYHVASRNSSNLMSTSANAIFTTPAASPSDYPTLTIGSGTSPLGGTVEIDVQFSPGLEPMNYLDFDLALPVGVRATSVVTGAAASSANMTASGISTPPSQFRVTVTGLMTTLSATGSVARISLAVDQTAFSGTQPLAVTRTLFVDTGNNIVAPVTVSGRLLITGGDAAIRVQPNPWRSDLYPASQPMWFKNLTPGSELRIFTASGYWVRTYKATASEVGWDLKNEDGNRVASGLYYYLVTGPDRKKATGEVVVIH